MELMTPSLGGERFRENVRELMQREGISVSELSRRSGCNRPGLSRLLNGQEDCTLERAFIIAKALEIPLSTLVGEKLSVGA